MTLRARLLAAQAVLALALAGAGAIAVAGLRGLGLAPEHLLRENERSAVLAAAAGAALLSGALLAFWLTSRVVRPLSILASAAQRIGRGDLSARARVRGEGEIGALAAEFNAMADRLAEYRASSLGELLLAQQAARAAIDALPDPVLILDLAGEVQDLNRAAEALLRLPHGDGGGAALATLDPGLGAALQAARERALAGGAAGPGPGLEAAVRVEGPGGERWLLPRAEPVHAEARAPGGVAIVLQDVTRLHRVDELRDDLVATVAHEFRTPLTSLRMAVHLCLEGAAGAITPTQADLLGAARQDCERLQGIVDDLLDLSRIQGGRLELARRPVAARALLEAAHAAARDAAAAAGCALGLRADDAVASADPEKVGLVLSNLLANALRHSPPGGAVLLSAAGGAAGGPVRFEVADAGEGIPPEYRQRIFERFFRVPGRPGGGAGLGLSLVREIVLAHGGAVGVESEPGRGSRFWFTLPAAGR